jgi:hypothetical protein
MWQAKSSLAALHLLACLRTVCAARLAIDIFASHSWL